MLHEKQDSPESRHQQRGPSRHWGDAIFNKGFPTTRRKRRGQMVSQTWTLKDRRKNGWGRGVGGCRTEVTKSSPCRESWVQRFFFCLFIFERERVSRGGAKREREKERQRTWSRLQAPSCQHRAWLRAPTHEPWDHDLSRSGTLNWLATQVPWARRFS